MSLDSPEAPRSYEETLEAINSEIFGKLKFGENFFVDSSLPGREDPENCHFFEGNVHKYNPIQIDDVLLADMQRHGLINDAHCAVYGRYQPFIAHLVTSDGRYLFLNFSSVDGTADTPVKYYLIQWLKHY